MAKSTSDEHIRIANAYRQALSREPTIVETDRALVFLDRYAKTTDRPRAWAAWCQVMLASSEFLSLD